ncbi:MAG: hypothetical protein QM654_10060 [Dysgonamonadaceae bacterium]
MEINKSVFVIFLIIISSLVTVYMGMNFSVDIYRTQQLILLLLLSSVGLMCCSIVYRKEKWNLPISLLLILLLIACYQIAISNVSLELYLQILLFFCCFILFYQYIQKQQDSALCEIAIVYPLLKEANKNN